MRSPHDPPPVLAESKRVRVRLYLLFGLLLAALAAVAHVVTTAQHAQREDEQLVVRSSDLVDSLEEVLLAMVDAETGERGFVITGDERFLEPWRAANERLDEQLEAVVALAAGDPDMEPLADSVVLVADRARSLIEQVITVRREQGADAARELVGRRAVKEQMDALRGLVARAVRIEEAHLGRLTAAASHAATRAEIAVTAGFVLTVLILALSMWLIRREALRRAALEDGLRRSRDELAQAVSHADALLRGRENLRRFTDQLQSCRSVDEADAALARGMPRIVPEAAGAIARVNPSQVYLEVQQAWGAAPATSAVFAPDECMALRRGRPYWRLQPQADIPCKHLVDAGDVPTVCYPLIAQNENLGVLVFSGGSLADLDADARELLSLAGETISVVLANLRLQEALRNQSVQDPLTGLYNRRHMEVALEREVARARRAQGPLAVVMGDIDHFKQYNDTFGHDAADAVLVSVARVLASHTRAEDIACRYGGEEFLLVLPGITAAKARERALQIRAAVEELRPGFRGRTLGAVTLSLGVALLPGNGESAADLVNAADQALYRAKKEGRNRVCVAAPSDVN